MNPGNRREAALEVGLDIAEGADVVSAWSSRPACTSTSWPTSPRRPRCPSPPIRSAAKYSMLEAAAATGYIDRERAIAESLVAIRRAGADMTLTYWALEAATNPAIQELL